MNLSLAWASAWPCLTSLMLYLGATVSTQILQLCVVKTGLFKVNLFNVALGGKCSEFLLLAAFVTVGFGSWIKYGSWWRLAVFCCWFPSIFREASTDVSAGCSLVQKFMALNVPQLWTLDPVELLSPLHRHFTASNNQTQCCSSLQGSTILYILPWMNLNKEEINLKVTWGGWFHAVKGASCNFSVLCILVINFDETEVAVLHSTRCPADLCVLPQGLAESWCSEGRAAAHFHLGVCLDPVG